MSFKKCKVVMLPTNEKAGKISMGNTSLKLDYHIFPMEKGGIYTNHTYQHLYFLSDKEIKEGDWFIMNNCIVRQCSLHKGDILDTIGGLHHESICKKIIATTDTSLSTNSSDKEYKYLHYLPQPSQSFIQKFVEEYNKENVITEVMVEYEYDSYSTKTDGELIADFKLKINPKDNTITIRKIKDSWSREEVIKLINKISEEVDFESATQKTINEWIEENL